ncbi:MAG: GTPase HflX [Phototrophicales bacterium]|nr:MAG: GTPase HflX [Phototrophicales bacterium]
MRFYVPEDHQIERGYLVGLEIRGSRPILSVEDSLEELGLLADTAGIEVIGQTTQRLNRVHPSTFIGPGKVEEIKAEIEAHNIQVVIFDDELSPRHQRELEKAFGEKVKVLDRSALILDIFAQHAATREGRLQVELAQYEYRLPRLTRQWTHLARQAGGGGGRGGHGGVGLRGPGETQLEADRREISNIISRLKDELEQVRAHRQRQRQQREKTSMPVVALVGYTNAGKSTLMRTITNADVYVADQLFATLDTTTRRITLPSGREVLLSDTVGFIQKLPTTLIAAFRATLEGITEADMLLHIVDASHPNVWQQVETVEDTLAQIDVPNIPRILVRNKCDLPIRGPLTPPPEFNPSEYDAIVDISAKTGQGIPELLELISESLKKNMVKMTVNVPYQNGDVISFLHNRAIIDEETHTGSGVIATVRVMPRDVEWLTRFALPSS